MFNLDLTLIETRLKHHGLHVQPALVMPNLTSNPLTKDTVFVMLLEDRADTGDVLGGYDIQQYTKETFAVIVGVRSPGNVTGTSATNKMKVLVDTIKDALIGLIIDDFEPIEYEIGRMIEVNRQTQNVLYQLQFKTAHTVVTQVKHYDCN